MIFHQYWNKHLGNTIGKKCYTESDNSDVENAIIGPNTG